MIFQCYRLGNNTIIYAKFFPVTGLQKKKNQPVQLPEIEILPAGFEYFDDILMSVLMIERRRHAPEATKGLFNYRLLSNSNTL